MVAAPVRRRELRKVITRPAAVLPEKANFKMNEKLPIGTILWAPKPPYAKEIYPMRGEIWGYDGDNYRIKVRSEYRFDPRNDIYQCPPHVVINVPLSSKQFNNQMETYYFTDKATAEKVMQYLWGEDA